MLRMTEREKELMNGISNDEWLCKSDDCYLHCDSHPCLIVKNLREKYLNNCSISKKIKEES